MAFEWMDNFSQYGTNEDFMLDGLYAEYVTGTSLVTDPDGVSAGKVISPQTLRRVFSGHLTTVIINFRLWVDDLPGDHYNLLSLRGDANNSQVVMQVDSVGNIEVYRGTSSVSGPTSLLGETSTPAIVASSWIYVEAKYTAGNASDGSFEIRVNEDTVLAISGVNTSHVSSPVTYFSQVALSSDASHDGGSGHSGQLKMKDVIVMNTSGSQNNDFIGDYEVVTLLPASDDTMPWAKSTGATGFDLIDETTPVDSDYIYADASPPVAAIVTLTDLDPDVTTVAGLMSVVRALKTDAGTATLQVGLMTAGDTDNGADRAVATSATGYGDVSELSPDTGVPWTPAEVNAGKLKLNRTA